MLKDPLYRLVYKFVVLILAVILLCRYASFFGILAVASVGIFYSLRGNAGISLFVYILLPFLTLLNPLILPKAPLFAIATRLTTLTIAGALILSGSKRQGNEQLPLGYIFLYLAIAFVSSVQGYFPLISYFKIINFTAFLLGIMLGTKNINQKKEDLFFLRAAFLAIGIIIIWGSLAALPFPSIAYFTSVRSVIVADGIEAAEDALANKATNGLFTGITAHSQFLGPCLACLGGWIACDLLFVERKMRHLHLLLLAPVPIMIAMTKSRIGLLSFCMLVAILLAFCMPRIRLPEKVRRHINSLLIAFVFLFVAIAIFAEVRYSSVSRLIRKTDDLYEDSRTLLEALTSSRQETINECLRDFHRNPLWGMGFQVSAQHRMQFQLGQISLFSAPIEKGILPLMVLGETGIIGSITFALFLFLFFHDAVQKNYISTMTLFLAFLVTNFAEATFFSPSGAGGVFWMFTVCGGFLIDMSLKVANEELPAETAKGVAPLNPHRRSRISLENLQPVPKKKLWIRRRRR